MKTIIRILIVALLLLSAGNSDARRSSGTKKQSLGTSMISDDGDADDTPKNNQVLQQLERMGVTLSQDQLDMLQSFDDDMLDGYGQQFVSMLDPAYEWNQFDSKISKAIMTDKGLVLESKLPNRIVATTTELPFNPEDPTFEFGLSFVNLKPQEYKYIGFVFNYESDRKYEGVLISKRHYKFFIVENGEMSISKQGFAKTGKFILNILMKCEHNRAEFYVNGVEIKTLKQFNLINSNVGLAILGKMSVLCDKFYYKDIDEVDDSEGSSLAE